MAVVCRYSKFSISNHFQNVYEIRFIVYNHKSWQSTIIILGRDSWEWTK